MRKYQGTRVAPLVMADYVRIKAMAMNLYRWGQSRTQQKAVTVTGRDRALASSVVNFPIPCAMIPYCTATEAVHRNYRRRDSPPVPAPQGEELDSNAYRYRY